MKVKICGLTREGDALFAASCGAEYLGFIFVDDSKRVVEPEQVARIARAVRAQCGSGLQPAPGPPQGGLKPAATQTQAEPGGLKPAAPQIVGVFRDASHERIRDVARRATLDLVQLHGHEEDDDLRALGIPAIKTLHIGETLPDTTAHPSAAWLLFDTWNDRLAGGSGRRFDWSLLSMYERAKPFFLSGGITPDNVAAAISVVRPDGIDLASGVESAPGVKDHALISKLFDRVRGA